MKQFIRDNSGFLFIATVITILALFKVSNANAYELRGFKTGMTLSEAKQVDLNQMNASGDHKGERYLKCKDYDKFELYCEAVMDSKHQGFSPDPLRVSVGEYDFTPLFVFYKDGDKEPVLASIYAAIGTGAFDDVAVAMKKKYGVSPKATGTLQNGFGARFVQQEIYISNSTGSIFVKKYGTGGNKDGSLYYVDTKAFNALQAAIKKAKEATKNGL